ncbi:MAG: hypothetical protein ACPGJS_00735 [Flammeovirgaceae bacterium]
MENTLAVIAFLLVTGTLVYGIYSAFFTKALPESEEKTVGKKRPDGKTKKISIILNLNSENQVKAIEAKNGNVRALKAFANKYAMDFEAEKLKQLNKAKIIAARFGQDRMDCYIQFQCKS